MNHLQHIQLRFSQRRIAPAIKQLQSRIADLEADMTQAEALIEGVETEVVIGDKWYDSRKVVEVIKTKGAEEVTPPFKSRKAQREYDHDRSEPEPGGAVLAQGQTIPSRLDTA